MFKYVAMISGLLIMCVPDEAGLLRHVLQGGFGLFVFSLGAFLSMKDD